MSTEYLANHNNSVVWKTKFDYSEAKLLDLESSMPGVTVYLCDFHREQTWERWVKTITKDESEATYTVSTEYLATIRRVWCEYI